MHCKEGYDVVPSTECESSSEVESDLGRSVQARRRSWAPYVPWAALLVSLALNIILAVNFGQCDGDRKCAKATSIWSPALEAIESDYETVIYAGLKDENSPWRGPPTPELEEAWRSVTDGNGEIAVTKEEAVRAGMTLDPDTLVLFPDSYGGQVYTSIEWNHQLHCLNMLRKLIRKDYYKSLNAPGFGGAWNETENHMDHCVDILRQVIMCNADQGLVFSHWVQGRDHRHVNFNTPHKCRNFQKSLDWYKERAKPVRMSELVRKPGFVDLPDFPENLTKRAGGYKGNKFYQP